MPDKPRLLDQVRDKIRLKHYSQVGRTQDVPDMRRHEPGKHRATLRFCPTYQTTKLNHGGKLHITSLGRGEKQVSP